MAEKDTKWLLNQAIEAGKKSLPLATAYEAAITPRLEPDELKQHEANVIELAARQSGQKQNLSDQKSKTGKQDEVIGKINSKVVGIHNMVRSKNPTLEISEAFGIGQRIILTIGGVTAAANIVMDGFKKFPEWSKSAGIIEADNTKLKELLVTLGSSDKVQVDSMFTRKAKTMGKNELQRTVEDGVTRISAIGAHVFNDENPAVARLFEDLIPGTSKEKTETKPKQESKTEAKSE
jgi:hypothetical protein